ncbi:Ank 2 domain containing protein, partial [Asbolus verrucosus]
MHDAASNGYLEVVQLLLNKGANVVAKTDDGNTVLQFLKRWCSDVQLNSEAEALYKSIVVQITQALDKAGHANGRENLVKSTNRSELRRSTNIDELRRSTTVGLEDDISSNSHDDIVEDYRNAMHSLSHRNDKKTSKKTSDVVKSLSPPKSNLSVNKRRKQTKLSSFGHTRTLVEADSTTSPSFSEKKNSFDSTTKRSPRTLLNNAQSQPVMDLILPVDVRINEKLYRVPVLLSQVNTHTIKWLADEAASRYARDLKGAYLAPLCKVLNRQTNLLELHLSENFFTTECVQFLGIKLTNLDIGDNLIGDQSFESLVLLTRHFRLKKLNLSSNKFSKDLFTYSFNKNLTLTLDQIEEFDLPAANLKKLDVSRNSISHGFLRELLTVWGELDDVKLQTLKLSRCYMHDSDLFDLLKMSNSLETLDHSYNNELTSISLRRLLQCNPLVNLDLYGCYNIFKYFAELSKYVDQPTNEPKGKTIKLSVDSNKNHEESEYLVNMWKE